MRWNTVQIEKCSASVTTNTNNDDSVRDNAVTCNSIDSIAIKNSVPEIEGKTTFVQEACESVDVLGTSYSRGNLLRKDASIQDIKSYFERPRLIKTGSLPSTRTSVHSQNFSANSMIASATGGTARILGALGARFTAVFTLQVAATPFHQGLLSLGFEYNTTGINRSTTISRATNVPHVRLDLSSNTMAVLRVPFLSYAEFVYVGSGNSYGTVFLSTLLPVATVSGLAAPTYKLFLSLEDFETVGVVPAELQAVLPSKNGDYTVPAETIVEQSGLLDREIKLSSKLSMLSKTVGWVANRIPGITSLGSTTQWYLDSAAGVARYFGYAKPQIIDPPIKAMPFGSALEHNVDLPSNVVMLSAYAENHLATNTDATVVDTDEMALDFVLSQPSQIMVGKMATTSAHGTLLYGCFLSPSALWFRDKSAVTAAFNKPLTSALTADHTVQPSNIMYFASMFKLWRGAYRFRFTFSKTKMHAGRVCVAYVPAMDYIENGGNGILYPGSNAAGIQPTGYSAIFDLKDNNTFEFVVPFMATVPYLPYGFTHGSLSMTVIDPLVSPSVVSPSIDYLVEVSAEPGFELSVPSGPSLLPDWTDPIYEQSGILPNVYDDKISQVTIGEKINSLKQLIMLPKLTKLTFKPGTYLIDVPTWSYQPSVSPIATTREMTCYGGCIASCYGFVCGASDVHLYGPQDTNEFCAFAMLQNALDTGSGRSPGISSMPLHMAHDGVLHVRAPSFQQTPRMTVAAINLLASTWSPAFAADGSPVSGQVFNVPVASLYTRPSTPQLFPRLSLTNNTSTTITATLKRSAGDDARAIHFLGPPPVMMLTSEVDFPVAPAAVLLQGTSQ